jgi:hypothetical protein
MAKLKDDIKIIPGHTHILLIAPHGRASKPRDDINTDKIIFAAAEMLGCYAIVNDVFSKDDLDFNSIESAKSHPLFIDTIKTVVNADKIPVCYAFGKDRMCAACITSCNYRIYKISPHISNPMSSKK